MKKIIIVLYVLIAIVVSTIVFFQSRDGEPISLKNEMIDGLYVRGVEIKSIVDSKSHYVDKFEYRIVNQEDIDSFIYFIEHSESERFVSRDHQLSFDVYLKSQNLNKYKCHFLLSGDRKWIYFNFLNLSNSSIFKNDRYKIRYDYVDSFKGFLKRRIITESELL